MELTLAELAAFCTSQGISCEVEGDPAMRVSAVATLEDAGPADVGFLSNPKYEHQLATTKAAAVFVRPDVQPPHAMNLIRTSEPYAAVTAAIVRLHGYRRHPKWGVSERATIAADATIGPNANIAPNVYIDEASRSEPTPRSIPACTSPATVASATTSRCFPTW